MKFMKLGTKPDTFYTEAAVRSVLSDVPPDLIIHVKNTKYQLHKFPLILKCGLIQRLCSDTDEDSGHPIPVALHDIPGGEEAFELCAKFCYGISISLSAHNFVPALCAAKFLRMTETLAKGNFINKLELFFETCILQGWKDAVLTLQSIWRVSVGWSDDHRILQPCMDSIIEKILVHPSKVAWSYTYTRPGYSKKQHQSVPRDWWTEDVSDLDLDLFRSIMSTVRSTKKLPPALIGEALHVYACKHLPHPADVRSSAAQSSSARSDDTLSNHRRVLESIVSMIPSEPGSVSGGFLLRLLKVANYVGASSSTKAELVRRSGRQLDEVGTNDLLIPSASNPEAYDLGVVEALLANFLAQCRQREGTEGLAMSMARVGRTFDAYLQVIAQQDADLPVAKFIDLAESLPDMSREEHDGLYQAIDAYLKEHPELSKTEKKQLCQMIDCRKLSHEARATAIANDRLPLRTIVQLLFVEQEKSGSGAGSSGSHGGMLDQMRAAVSDARVVEVDEGGRSRNPKPERARAARPAPEPKAAKKEK